MPRHPCGRRFQRGGMLTGARSFASEWRACAPAGGGKGDTRWVLRRVCVATNAGRPGLRMALAGTTGQCWLRRGQITVQTAPTGAHASGSAQRFASGWFDVIQASKRPVSEPARCKRCAVRVTAELCAPGVYAPSRCLRARGIRWSPGVRRRLCAWLARRYACLHDVCADNVRTRRVRNAAAAAAAGSRARRQLGLASTHVESTARRDRTVSRSRVRVRTRRMHTGVRMRAGVHACALRWAWHIR